MTDYGIRDDIEILIELKNLTVQELAMEVGVSRATVQRWLKDDTMISAAHRDRLYDYAFQNKINLNRIKEQLFREDYTDNDHIVLFHGAKTEITGALSLQYARKNNDFGQGFYCGENFEQSAMFVSNFPKSSVYILCFQKKDLNMKQYRVDQDWMLTIAYFRGRLGEYANKPMIQDMIETLKNIDYVIAPIADNRMFEIIDSFIDGEITDVQCQHLLSATDLGYQYVCLSQRALDNIRILRHCYLSPAEKTYYLEARQQASALGRDKVRVARRQYRGQGRYIEEILV